MTDQIVENSTKYSANIDINLAEALKHLGQYPIVVNNTSSECITTISNLNSNEYDAFMNLENAPLETWYGKYLYFVLNRQVIYKYGGASDASDCVVKRFYFPHYDEPLHQKQSASESLLGVPVLTKLWTSTVSYNNNVQKGDIFLWFKSVDNRFHRVCFVISFYDTAGKTDTPYYEDVPLYFSEESGSAEIYNSEFAKNFIGNTEQAAYFLDNWEVKSYEFNINNIRTKHYSTLIGTLTTTNSFDCIRFRLNNSSNISQYKMYFHLFIDGNYANPEHVLVGRGISPDSNIESRWKYANFYELNKDVIQLSTLNNDLDGKVAVKFLCNTMANPKTWTVLPTTTYEYCPGESNDSNQNCN